MALQAIQGEKKIWRSFASTPGSILSTSITVLESFIEVLKRFRRIVRE